MTNMSFNNFSKAIASIKESYDAGTLYQKTLVNGQLQTKSVTALIGATYKHFTLWVKGELKQDNEQRMEKLFNECVEELKKSAPAESEVFKDTPSPYTLKITNYVINKLETNNKIPEEKMGFVNQLKDTADLIAKNPLLKHVMEDPDWLAIDSIKDVRDLYKKLENPYAKLTDKEIDLMKKCLRLAPKIVNMEITSVATDPQLATMVNNKEFSAIKKIAFRFADRADYLRAEYGKVYGSVKMEEDGRLIPTKEQLKGALDLAFKKMPLLMEHRTDPELRKLAARFVNTLMCDDEQIKTFKLPHNDFSFPILEALESEKDRNLEIKDLPYSSYLELQIMTQTSEFGKVIGDKFIEASKDLNYQFYLDDGNPEFLSHIFNFNQNPKEALENVLNCIKISPDFLQSKIREKLKTEKVVSAKEIETELKSQLMPKLKACINSLTDKDIGELKNTMQTTSIQKFLGNFLFDTVQRESSIRLGVKEYNLSKKENLEEFLTDFKENYYKLLHDNPQMLIKTVEQNKKNQEATGIKADMTPEEWGHDLSVVRGNTMSDSISTIVNGTSFSEEQIKELQDVSGLSIKEIEPLLRVKMMQMMLVINQSTEGLEPKSLDPSQPDRLQTQMYNAFDRDVNIKATMGFWIINPDFNGIKLAHLFTITTPNLNLSNQVRTPIGFNEKDVILGSVVKRVDINQLLPTENQETNWGRLNESTDFHVSVDGTPSIDTLLNVVVAEKK